MNFVNLQFLSLFPEFFNYQSLAITLLRLTLAFFILRFSEKLLWRKKIVEVVQKDQFHNPENTVDAHNKLQTEKVFLGFVGGVGIIGGILLGIGLFSQIVCIASAALFAVFIFLPGSEKHARELYFVLFMLSIALLALGAGKFAFDLPL